MYNRDVKFYLLICPNDKQKPKATDLKASNRKCKDKKTPRGERKRREKKKPSIGDRR